MKPSWITTDDGYTKGPMDTCGFLMCTTIRGDLTTTGDGFGIPSAGGHGVPMNRGDGVFPITADGIGESAWDGTGSLPAVGVRPGCIGIMGWII